MKYNVGDKFVIEIVQGYHSNVLEDKSSHRTTPEYLYRVLGFNALVFDENGLDKLDRLNDDYINENYGIFQDAAYQKGFEAGTNTAWDVAKKIVNMDAGEQYACFSRYFSIDIFSLYTASKALEKIREYEEKQEIKYEVGSEVTYNDGNRISKGVIISANSDEYGEIIYKILWNSSESTYAGQGDKKWMRNFTLTGRYFPQIAEVLEQMREADSNVQM